MDLDQIGCEMFINCSLLHCQFIVPAVSFTSASASRELEGNQRQDWTVGSQPFWVMLPSQQFGFIIRERMYQLPVLLLSCCFLFLHKLKRYSQSCQSGIYYKQQK